MKLLVQIPCYNEEAYLPETLKSLPRVIEGISKVEVLVIDDGSSDKTSEVAKKFGADHVLRLKNHRGLAYTFSQGLKKSIQLNADIVVNLDADNQYQGDDLPALIRPILKEKADVVLGARDFSAPHAEFSRLKSFFQKFGASVLSILCNVKIPDAATGFRAFSREAAKNLNVFTKYTYTMETLIHASQLGYRIVSIPIHTNPVKRPSRLIRHPILYVLQNAGAIIRLIVLYNPIRIFGLMAFLCFLAGFLTSYRITGASIGIVCFFTGLILDQIAINRRLLEGIRASLYDVSENNGRE